MTLDDVARAAGVSKATVSFVMNSKPGVGRKTRERVLKIAEEMGYGRLSARQAGKNAERRIQFLAVNTEAFPVKDNISNTFFAEMIRGLENACRLHDSLLMVSTLDMDDLETGLKTIVQNGRCMGTVLLGTNLSESEMKRIARSVTPVVVIDNAAETTNLNTVSINNYQGAFLAADYLAERGKGSIGYVMSESRLENFDERQRGFFGAIKQSRGSAWDVEKFQVSQGLSDAQRDLEHLLSQRTVPMPGALFCESDYIAIGVMRALQAAGRRIPDDIRVIGFDDVPEALIMQPELTTIQVNKEKLGEIAGNRIFELIGEPEQNALKIRIDTKLVVRKSAG